MDATEFFIIGILLGSIPTACGAYWIYVAGLREQKYEFEKRAEEIFSRGFLHGKTDSMIQSGRG